MPLQINPIELQPLAQLAGARVGNLGLPVANWGAYGENYVKAALGQDQLKEQYAGMLNDRAMNQLRLQGDFALKDMQNQFDWGKQQNQQQFDMSKQDQQNQFLAGQQKNLLDQKYAEMDQQGKFQQGQLTNMADRNKVLDNRTQVMSQNDQDNLKLHYADLDQKAQLMKMHQASLEDTKELNKFGAVASTVYSIYNSHDPSEWAQLTPSIVERIEKAYPDMPQQQKDQIEQVSKDPVALHDYIGGIITLSGHALDLKNNPVLQDKVGQYSQQNISQAQSITNGNVQILNNLAELRKNIPPQMLTAAGQGAAAASGLAEKYLPSASGIVNSVGQAVSGVDPQQLNATKAKTIQGMNAVTLELLNNQKKVNRPPNPAMQKLYQGMIPNINDDNTTFMTKYDAFYNQVKKDTIAEGGMLPSDQQKKILGQISDADSLYNGNKASSEDKQSSSKTEPQSYSYNGATIPSSRLAEVAKLNNMTVDQLKASLAGGK